MISLKKLIKTDRRFAFLIILCILFLISLIFFLAGFKGKRYYFNFKIADSTESLMEVRRLHSEKYRSNLQIYVEELLLGPSIQRGAPVFPVGTRVLFCFERKGELFLNLSQEAIGGVTETQIEKESTGENSSVIYGRYLLLKSNIKKNFPEIKDVILFVDSNPVFQKNPDGQ